MKSLCHMVAYVLGIGMLVAGMSGVAAAQIGVAPEIDPVSGMSALTLLGGALLAARSYRRK